MDIAKTFATLRIADHALNVPLSFPDPVVFPSSHTVFTRDNDGDTLLHTAVLLGMSKVAYRFTCGHENRQSLDIQNYLGETVLHISVLTGQMRMTKLLIACGACGKKQDERGDTPLHIACRLGDLDAVCALTKPLLCAKELPCMYRVPFAKLTDSAQITKSCLHVAMNGGYVDILRYLTVSRDVDINLPHALTGYTVLHMCCDNPGVEMFDFLVRERRETKVDFSPLSYSGQTPQDIAHGNGHLIVEKCIQMAAQKY